MTGGSLQIAMYFILGAGTIVAMTLCCLLLIKTYNGYANKRKNEILRKFEPYFIYLQLILNEDRPLPIPAMHLSRLERRVIQFKLMDLIDKSYGSRRDRLSALCDAAGFVDWQIEALNSRSGVRSVEAAYCLGRMRCRRAVPDLLEQLKRQKFGTTLFIIARSVAQCARSASDLEQMIREIVKHGKPVHRLTADILDESPISKDSLDELLRDSHPDVVRIVRLCLHRKVSA